MALFILYFILTKYKISFKGTSINNASIQRQVGFEKWASPYVQKSPISQNQV